ncbi:MAG: hypothetical protein JXB60_10065, partial [Candidatus Cloacimonetes bacterium]|nr:hypothetical protein [Candidatus Cloacimonadota bacterium]
HGFISRPYDAVQNAMAGCYILEEHPLACWQNPAVSGRGVEISGSFLYSLPELPLAIACYSTSIRKWGFSLSHSSLLHPLLKQNLSLVGVNYGNEFLAGGLALSFINYTYHDRGKFSAFSLNSGFYWQLGIFKSGFSCHNILQSRLGSATLPVLYSYETRLQLPGNVIIGCGLEKETGYDFSLRFASSISITKFLKLFTGYQYNPDRIGTGIMIILRNYHLCYSVRNHQILPYTHYLSISYVF